MTADATARTVDGWHLVESGSWQVSVAPDGLLMLPRHLHPDEVEDFVNAILAASEVGKKVRADNEKAGRSDDRSPLGSTIQVAEGGVPAGAMRVNTAAGSNPEPLPRGSIGRRTRNPSSQGLKPPAVQPPRVRGARRR